MGRLVTGSDNPTVLYVSGGNTQVRYSNSGGIKGIFFGGKQSQSSRFFPSSFLYFFTFFLTVPHPFYKFSFLFSHISYCLPLFPSRSAKISFPASYATALYKLHYRRRLLKNVVFIPMFRHSPPKLLPLWMFKHL